MMSKNDHPPDCPPRFSCTRHTFSIPAGQDGEEEIAMWAFIPDKDINAQPSPSIVMANGLALPRSAGLPHIATCFAADGYNVFLFDFRHLGDSTGYPRQLVSVTRQREDYISVLRYVSDPDRHHNLFGQHTLDPNRVVLWGWSNSGGHVTYLAGRSDIPAISAVIAIDPLCDGLGNFLYHIQKFPFALFNIAHQIFGDLFASLVPGFSAIVVPALGPGGILGSEEAGQGARQITPEDGPPFVNNVAARYVFDVLFNRASGASVQCPIMVSWARDEGDGLIPSYLPQRFAEDAGEAGALVEVYKHDGDHFAIHPGGRAFKETIRRQLEFLSSTVGKTQ
ncbi:esterase [Melampsora americana]|nr:esterase [Melampsora americana]